MRFLANLSTFSCLKLLKYTDSPTIITHQKKIFFSGIFGALITDMVDGRVLHDTLCGITGSDRTVYIERSCGEIIDMRLKVCRDVELKKLSKNSVAVAK